MIYLKYILVSFYSALSFRIRGGGWFTLGSDVYCRLIWAFAVTLSYIVLHKFSYVYLTFLVTAFVSLYVPHSAVQNMGRWATPQKQWPQFFLPTYTQEQWDNLSQFDKTFNDFMGMAAVGFFRGIICFMPLFLHETQNFVLAVIAITILQPVSYFLGWLVPITITSSLTKNSAQWAEFINGALWVIPLAIA